MKKKIKKTIQQRVISAQTICNFFGIDYCEIVDRPKRFLRILQSLIVEYVKKYSSKVKKLLRENFNFKKNYKLAGLSADL